MGDEDGVAIHLFRRGLRLHDNPAFLHAIDSCTTLIPLFVVETEHLDSDLVSANRVGFLLNTLKCLDESLRARGSRLVIVKGRTTLDVLEAFFKQFNVKKLTLERGTEPHNVAFQTELCKMAEFQYGVDVTSFWSHTLYDLDYILSLNNGKSPMTMTDFLKIASYADPPLDPVLQPDAIPPLPDLSGTTVAMNINILPGVPNLSFLEEYGYTEEENTTWFPAGEKEAIKRMDDFLSHKQTFEKTNTDPTSLVPDTSALSPYLSVGSLSVRLFHAKLKEALRVTETRLRYLSVSLEGQVYWRELSYLIGYVTPNFNRMLDNPICMQIPWLEEAKAKELVGKWELGQTGYPAVDASMNQLRTDGWLHHIARQLVACFLTRGDLWVSWELGRDVFDKHLVDDDWSINNFSWHWLSCSAFFDDYKDIYDPVALFRKTDPAGIFVRKYIPALRHYPNEYIYEPWKAPEHVQEESGCVIGRHYPAPIVDHVIASQENIKKLQVLFEGEDPLLLLPPPKKTSV